MNRDRKYIYKNLEEFKEAYPSIPDNRLLETYSMWRASFIRFSRRYGDLKDDLRKTPPENPSIKDHVV